MTNGELCLKVIQELGNDYKLGLHHSTKESYVYKSKYNFDKFYFDENFVTEDVIISSILENGLYVPERSFGIRSTVTFWDKIKPNIFNYCYYANGNDRFYNVIIAIPNYIYLDDNKYFIANKIDYDNFANYVLFYKLLPKEFIYGYYVKKVNYVKTESCDENILSSKIVFEDDLEFYSNSNFYGYMTKREQDDFWINYFKESKIDISLLEKVAGFDIWVRNFKDFGNKYMISQTRRQLIKRKKK